MKVLLINPPSANEHVPENPPLGLLYLASSLLEKHDVWVLDFDALKYDWKQIEDRLVKEKPDFIGVTCTTYSYYNALKICEVAKKKLKKTKLIIGGPHVSAYPERCLQKSNADFVVVGEGEEVVQEVVNGETKEKIIYGNPVNVNKSPLPSRDLLEPDITSYLGNMPRHFHPETVMLWSRGCPHNCLFCSNVIFKKQPIRFRSPENIVKEIKELADYGIKEIFVYDDELIGAHNLQNKWLSEVCNLIATNGLNKITFKCQGRCSRFVNLETLQIMKQAGFKTIMWGCESGSDKVLKAIRKGATVEEIKQSIALCKQAGIEAWMFLMIGNYREKTKDIEKTIRLVKECKPDHIQATYATPYPSDFEKICIKNKWIIEQDTTKWNTNKPVIKTGWLSQEQLVNYRKKLLDAHKFRLEKDIINTMITTKENNNQYNRHLRLLYKTYKNYGLIETIKIVNNYLRMR